MTREPREPGSGRTSIPMRLSAGLSIAAIVALYWPAREAGFVGDDFMILHRLRALGAPADTLGFFRTEFFAYYRPLGFVSHAIDWFAAGADPGRFHLTNILLHGVNALFVLLIAQRLSGRLLAGVLAALLFGVHASNHEAVAWISARFDLLATAFALAAICWMVRSWPGERWGPPLLVLGAVLSKESAVGLPLVVLAWGAFVRGETTRAVALRAAPWLAALLVYGLLREAAGGISAIGGASRIPKLAALGIATATLLALSNGRWEGLRRWLLRRRAGVAGIAAAVLVATLLLATLGGGGASHLAREKLSVAAFALFYLSTPVLDGGTAVFSDPTTAAYVLGGAAGLAVTTLVVLWFWRPLLADPRIWFLAAVLFATLLPISALTEGKRYLYLPSAVCAVLIGMLIAELRSRGGRHAALAAAALAVGISAVQVHLKIRDWRWAGAMTADAVRLVHEDLAPACDGHVIFLTSPVGVRGVYTHFYYETFELPRDCVPGIFQVLLRVERQDIQVRARHEGLGRIVMTATGDAGQLVGSRDLRTFDRAIAPGEPTIIDTVLGRLHAEPRDSGLDITLALDEDARHAKIRFYYYDNGRIHRLAGAPSNAVQ